MPEGQDPYGSSAYYQRIRKEMRSAIAFSQARRYGLQLPLGGPNIAPPGMGFVLSNPITHVDRIVTSASASRRPAPQQQQQQQQQQLPPLQQRAEQSVGSGGGGGGSCGDNDDANDPVIAAKLAVLERTLQEEQSQRQRVQSDLERLEGLLQKRMAAAASGQPPQPPGLPPRPAAGGSSLPKATPTPAARVTAPSVRGGSAARGGVRVR